MDHNLEISAAEAAKLLGVSASHVSWYFRKGYLPGRRIGERVLVFRREDVENFEKPKKSGRPRTKPTKAKGNARGK